MATDAAREGLNFQAHCADLFHFDLPWNPGRIDRKLQPAPEVRCHYFVLPQRVEDRVLEVLVRKTETSKRELGSLSKVIADDVERRMRGGIRHREADRLKREIEAADLDAVRRQITEEELEAARDRRDDVTDQVERCRGLLERSRHWVGFESAPFRQALSCALELLGAEPLARSVDSNSGGRERGPGRSRRSTAGPGPTRRGRQCWTRSARLAGRQENRLATRIDVRGGSRLDSEHRTDQADGGGTPALQFPGAGANCQIPYPRDCSSRSATPRRSITGWCWSLHPADPGRPRRCEMLRGVRAHSPSISTWSFRAG